MLAGRVVGVQLLQREQLRVDRGQQAGVERAEQPGPLRGLADQDGLLPGGVRGVDVPGQLAGHGGGGQPSPAIVLPRLADWLSRHLDCVDPAAAEAVRRRLPKRTDARWLPATTRLGFADVPSYLRERHINRHWTVNAIAAEVGLTHHTVEAALRRHGLAEDRARGETASGAPARCAASA